MIKSIEKSNSESLVKELLLAKKELISSKKIMDKKDGHIYPIKDIPFEISENWQWAFLSDISIIQEGPGIRKHQYQDEGIQFITVTNILEGSVDLLKSQKYISLKEYEEKYKHYTINKGDIVTACSGATWGKSAIYENDIPLMLNTSTLRLRFFNDLGDNKYLYYLTKSNYFKSNLALHLTGQQPNYGYSHYSKIPVPIPPLQEQQQIVAILDQGFEAIDQAKANIEKNIANAKELFENTLQKLFDKKDWDLKRLGEIATFKNGMNFTNSSKGQSIEIVGVKNFKNNFWVPIHELENVILDGEMSELYQLKKGDILTVRSNGNPKLIGRTLLADEVSSIVSHSGFTIRIRLNSNTILPTFLCHFLKTAKTIKELVDSGNGVGIKSLNQVSLSSLMIPFPESEQEQQIIVDKIEEISIQTKQIESHYKQKLNNLEDLKKSILQKAFAGELTSPERTQYSKDGRSPSDETQTNKNPERVT